MNVFPYRMNDPSSSIPSLRVSHRFFVAFFVVFFSTSQDGAGEILVKETTDPLRARSKKSGAGGGGGGGSSSPPNPGPTRKRKNFGAAKKNTTMNLTSQKDGAVDAEMPPSMKSQSGDQPVSSPSAGHKSKKSPSPTPTLDALSSEKTDQLANKLDPPPGRNSLRSIVQNVFRRLNPVRNGSVEKIIVEVSEQHGEYHPLRRGS